MAEDKPDAAVDVYLNEAEASKWGAIDMQSFAESFAGWAAQPSRKFSGLDIEMLLRKLRNEKIRFRVIGYNEFPYKKTWQIEREYWLASDDGLVVLHVHYADKWHDKLEERGKCDVIQQINIRHTVTHEAAVPGVNAYWHKCEDLDEWKELHGEPIFTIPAQGWRWREKLHGTRWDNGFAPVIHDLLTEVEKCTTWVRAVKAVQLVISPGTRKALCIGVEEYAAVNKLRNAVQDMVSLKSRLEELRWSVDSVYNPGQRAFKKAIEKFADVVEKSSDACLFAFVGHGVELQGEHFFLPADFELEEKYRTENLLLQDVKEKAVAFSYLEECIKAVRDKPSASQVSLFVLDCCRESISARVGSTSRTLSSFPQRGGQPVQASTTVVNSFVIYSTSKGSTAGDGAAGKGGPFMSIFTEEMMVPGSIEGVMKRTRQRLLTDTCQLSPEQSTLTTAFSFCPVTASPAAAASPQGRAQHEQPAMHQHVLEVLRKWKLGHVADAIAGIGVLELDHIEDVEEQDIDELRLPPVTTRRIKRMIDEIKQSIAKKLVEDDLSGQSTDEDAVQSESESECESPGFAAGHVIAAYSSHNLDQFLASITKLLVAVRESALEWLEVDGDGKDRRHPFCASVLLDVLRHTRFKDEGGVALANAWFENCVEGNMSLSGDILEGFAAVLERGSLPTEVLHAQTSSNNAKPHRRCIAVVDTAVRLLHQQSTWGDVSEWNENVVNGWFTNSEGAVGFLDKAEAYLRRYALPEKLDLKVLEGAVEAGSFVAFLLADRFTQMLLFAVVEYRTVSSIERRSGMQAESGSSGDVTMAGFCFLASSTGRACDLRGGKARCQLRGSRAVVCLLQLIASLPLSQSILLDSLSSPSLSAAHPDRPDLSQDRAINSFAASMVGVLADEAVSEAVADYCNTGARSEAASVSAEVSRGKGKGAKDAGPWGDDEVDVGKQKFEKGKEPGEYGCKGKGAKDADRDDDEVSRVAKTFEKSKEPGEYGGIPVEDFVGEVDHDFLCGICYCVMLKPHSCREGHTFCFRCIHRWLARERTCPIAREPLLESELCNNRSVQRMIEKLPMHCPAAVSNQVGASASGCKWTGLLSERDAHLMECDHCNRGVDEKAKIDTEELAMLLHEAVFSGDVDEAREMLAAGANTDRQDKDGYTPLHWAASKGKDEIARAIVEAGANKDAKDKRGRTPLHCAALRGHVEAARALLEAGADKNAKDKKGGTPLHYAAIDGHLEVACSLLEAGADKEAKARDEHTPLHYAAEEGHVEVAMLLLEAGADTEAKDEKGRRPLHCAAELDYADVARALLEAGADKEAPAHGYTTALHYATQEGHLDMVRMLLEAGADKEAINKHAATPLHIAATSGHLEIARMLLEAGADKEAKDKFKCTPLHYAAQGCHIEVVRMMLEAGADKDAKAEHAATPLHVAATNSHLEITRMLLEVGADKETKAEYGRTPLHYAAMKGHLNMVRMLLEAGADKEAKDKYGGTPLHYAAQGGHLNMVRLLLEAGADKQAKDTSGKTPLHRAAFNGHLEIARMLLEAGADKEAKDEYGRTALNTAVEKGHLETARLLEAGVDSEAKAEHARYALLIIAVRDGDIDMARMLLEAGADKEAKDEHAATPLHIAATSGHLEIARMLLEAGADKEAKDKWGLSPLHRAAFRDHLALVRLLLEAGVDKEAKDTENSLTPLSIAARNLCVEVVKVLLSAGADKTVRTLEGTIVQIAEDDIENEGKLTELMSGPKCEAGHTMLRSAELYPGGEKWGCDGCDHEGLDCERWWCELCSSDLCIPCAAVPGTGLHAI